jgi:hypothetical protein
MLLRRSALAALVLGLVACNQPTQTGEEETGTVDIAVAAFTVDPALIPVLVPNAVYVHVYGTTSKGATFDQWFQALPDGSTWRLALNKMPAGTYQLHGEAFLDGAAAPGVDPPDYATPNPPPDPSFTVVSKGTTTATLVLQQTAAPVTVNNHAPTVDSVIASAYAVDSTAATPDVIRLVATASDVDLADQGSLSYLWTDDVGGTFSSDATLATDWTPPPDYVGTVAVTFAVTDFAGARSAVTLKLNVSPGNARGALIVVVDMNTWPIIEAITADNAQIVPGGSATIAALASDPDGDSFTYAWTAACVDAAGPIAGTGLFGAPDAAETSYAPPAGATACTLTLTVAGPAARGGENTGTLVVNVKVPPIEYRPEFISTQMTPTLPAPGNNITFIALATEWNGTADVPTATYTWASSVPGGTFTPMAPDGSRVVYQPAACGAPGVVSYVVTATAVGSAPFGVPNDSTLTFPFTITCP